MIVQVSSKAAMNTANTLAVMQETGELCDFTITVGDAKIRAHRCILAASCEYFRTSFRFSEMSQESSKIDLTHLDCSASVVDKVIRSFYTSEIDLEPCSVDSVLRLVDYFMCEELRDAIGVFMEKSLSFHNAVLYFQLALQYSLNNTSLFRNAQCYLWFRFHDYFIYHPDTLASCVEVVKAFQEYRLFHFCTPLQVTEFLMDNLKMSISHQDHSSSDCSESWKDRVQQTFSVLRSVLLKMDGLTKETWNHLLCNYLSCLDFADMCHGETLACFQEQVTKILNLLRSDLTANSNDVTCVESGTDFIVEPEGDVDTGVSLLMADVNSSKFENKNNANIFPALAVDGKIVHSESDQPMYNSDDVYVDSYRGQTFTVAAAPVCHVPVESSISKPKTEPCHSSKWDFPKLDTPASDSCKPPQTHGSCFSESDTNANSVTTVKTSSSATSTYPGQDQSLTPDKQIEQGPESKLDQVEQSEVLVLLAPSAEMSSQINAVEAGRSWPLLEHPQLELAFYDIKQRTWRQTEKISFPVQGSMQEKHAWRMAFYKESVYLFSLVKSKCLEYNVAKKSWSHLECPQLFSPHQENSPVKSIIPISVGNKLIVLSMSREPRPDGSFLTQQDFYMLESESKTFRLVATVHDERMDLPITQWTVNGNLLITVKASTMMYRHLSQIQYIHVFDAKTCELKTHNVVCAMESGIKVLARGDILYLVDKEGWCRSFSLRTSEWTGMMRYPKQGQACFVSPYGVQSMYPALTRVTCHFGSSRWEVTTCHVSCNAYLQETLINEQGTLQIKQHPPPPYQFFTALCPGVMDSQQLHALQHAKFEVSESKNL